MIVPESPEPFLVEFLPAFVAEIGGPSGPGASGSASALGRGSDAAPRSRRAPSGAGVAVRVVGAGEWTLRLSDGALVVSLGVAGDVALQISLRAEDFTRLVVEPIRTALQAPDDGTNTRALAARSFWTRLGRFDDETAELLRRQEGRILVRIDDGGNARHIALTPGLIEHSLDRAECCIDCEITALEAVQARRKNPLDLFYEGQIRITGDAQIALAMAGLFL